MKKYVYIIIGIILIIIVGCLFSCNNNYIPPVEKIVYVSVKDNFGEDLFITNYKLGRIKYYNDIAAKGNNIKYLRGWINRVLNE